MEVLKKKSEENSKNKLIYFLITCIVLLSAVFAFHYKSLIDDYMHHAYIVSESTSYNATLEKGYRVGPVSIRSFLRTFYGTQFTFNGDTYDANVKYAQDYLLDYSTAKYIQSTLEKGNIKSELIKLDAQLITVLDSISPRNPDTSREPVIIKAYCTQSVVAGGERSEKRFVNSMEIYWSNIPVIDENPHGLKIKKWANLIEE